MPEPKPPAAAPAPPPPTDRREPATPVDPGRTAEPPDVPARSTAGADPTTEPREAPASTSVSGTDPADEQPEESAPTAVSADPAAEPTEGPAPRGVAPDLAIEPPDEPATSAVTGPPAVEPPAPRATTAIGAGLSVEPPTSALAGQHDRAAPAPGSSSWPPPPSGSEGADLPPPPWARDPDADWPRPQRWRRVVAGIAAVLAVVLLSWTIVGGGGRTARDDSDQAADQADTDPVPTTAPEPATPAEVEAVVAEISDFVARERGVPFLEPVEVELLDEGAFQDRLLADFDEDVDELRRQEHAFKALGLVDTDVDLVVAMRSLLGAGVVGFYEPETGELVVRGASVTPYVRTTIAHELTHALDDQHHDLDRPEYDDAADEVGFGFSAVVEGNARRIETAYHDAMSADERAQATSEEFALGAGIDLGAVPVVLIEFMAAPYQLGQALVDDLVAEGGNDSLAAAFADPPTTSEQVIDPGAYAAREGRLEVPHPQVTGQVVDEGVLGQFIIDILLRSEMGRSAEDAADGWGGDWAVVWTDGTRSCVTLTVVGDDVEETEELAQAFDRWAAERDAVTVTPGRGGPFNVESCTG